MSIGSSTPTSSGSGAYSAEFHRDVAIPDLEYFTGQDVARIIGIKGKSPLSLRPTVEKEALAHKKGAIFRGICARLLTRI